MTKRRAPIHIIEKLKDLRSKTTFETANFGFSPPNEYLRVHAWEWDANQKTDITEFIRKQTHLYRETWMLSLIDELLMWAEGRNATPSTDER